MNWFTNAPIRIKLISIMTLTAMLALCLATVAIVINEYVTKKQETEKQLSLIADIFSWNSSASLAINDTKTAVEMLAGLKKLPSLVSASLYNETGAIFADFQATGMPAPNWTAETIKALIETPKNNPEQQTILYPLLHQLSDWGQFFKKNTITPPASRYRQAIVYDDNQYIHLLKPIVHGNELAGILHLVDNQSELQGLLNRFYLIIGLIFVVTGLCIFLISQHLQRIFLSPLLELMQAMRSFTP